MKTASEFIAFFEAIPEEKWCTGKYQFGDRRCAYGHLGVVAGGGGTEDSRNLGELISDHSVSWINDGEVAAFPQSTPKQRILAALREIEGKE